MDFPHANLFENSSYPCYWLSTTGEFSQNSFAQAPALSSVSQAIMIILKNIQNSNLTSPTSLISPSGNTLSIYPVDGGLLAVESPNSLIPSNPISSQLRENLSNIFALLSLVNQKVEESAIPYLKEIESNCYKTLRLASNLENINHISPACDSLQLVDFAALSTSLFESLQTVCPHLNIPISTDFPSMPMPIRASKSLLTEAILNIVRNSFQFTRDGNHLEVRLYEKRGKAVLTIRDYGLGIKSEYLPEIFLPYFSVDPYGDNLFPPGLGLGLAVAHHTVRSFCGAITAQSTFGEGTTISISFPLDHSSDDVLGSEPVDYLLDRYSPIYIQLSGFCRSPVL